MCIRHCRFYRSFLGISNKEVNRKQISRPTCESVYSAAAHITDVVVAGLFVVELSRGID